MRRQSFSLILTVLIALALAQTAAAQPSVYSPVPTYSSPRPALSPYLNLLRGGDPASNYFMGVLPNQDLRALQARPPYMVEASRLDPSIDVPLDPDLRDKQLPPTGHPSGFLIYNAYFNLPNQRSYLPYNPGNTRPR